MKKSEFMRQFGGLKIGMKFQAAPDSENPKMQFEITKTGLKDADGFPAVELTFSDGEKEVSAIAGLMDGIDNCGLLFIA